MRIIKFIILITFLFNSSAYPYQSISGNLRVPMMGDKTNKDRLKSARELASEQNIREKFGIYDYRPGVWEATEKAIEKRFITNKERKEALEHVFSLVRKLAENKIGPYYTLQFTIPAVAKVAKNLTELKDACDSLLNLNMKLAENKIDPYYTLIFAIPAVAEVAKNADELKLFINLGVRLAEHGVDPRAMLEFGIPVVSEKTKDMNDLKDACNGLFNLNMSLAKIRIEIWELVLPTAGTVVSNVKDLIEICSYLIPKVDRAVGRNWDRETLYYEKGKKADGLAMSTQLIGNIIELKKRLGDFKLIFIPARHYYEQVEVSWDTVNLETRLKRPAYFKVAPPTQLVLLFHKFQKLRASL
jgi:hypothetical protein